MRETIMENVETIEKAVIERRFGQEEKATTKNGWSGGNSEKENERQKSMVRAKRRLREGGAKE